MATDKYTISIMAVKAWQDIWARIFGEMPLRVTMEILIQSELDWLNQDFKNLLNKQAVSHKWVAQDEIWKQVIDANNTESCRLLPLLSDSTVSTNR